MALFLLLMALAASELLVTETLSDSELLQSMMDEPAQEKLQCFAITSKLRLLLHKNIPIIRNVTQVWLHHTIMCCHAFQCVAMRWCFLSALGCYSR